MAPRLLEVVLMAATVPRARTERAATATPTRRQDFSGSAGMSASASVLSEP